MDMEIVNRLKKMSKEEIGTIRVKEIAPLDAIWNLIEYIRELEKKSGVLEEPTPKVPGLEG